MNPAEKKSNPVANALGILQLFIGLGAVGGGLGLILEPGGSNLEMPVEMLRHSPFPDYLVPGLVLLIINGFGNIAGGVFSFRLFPYAMHIALVLGAFLVAWIVIQVYWIHAFHWLHALYFVLGIAECVLGWLLGKTVHA